VGGLFPADLNKITNANLLEEIIGHDIILLTETHLGKDENIVPILSNTSTSDWNI
jgi:hypothetical protein